MNSMDNADTRYTVASHGMGKMLSGYISAADIKCCEQGNLEKKELSCVYGCRGIRVHHGGTGVAAGSRRDSRSREWRIASQLLA